MIDINKKYIYRNGEEARILCVDRPNTLNVISMDITGTIHTHKICGSYWGDCTISERDLIEVKEKKVLWLNLYGASGLISGYVHSTLDQAKNTLNNSITARIKVEYEDGQFDE